MSTLSPKNNSTPFDVAAKDLESFQTILNESQDFPLNIESHYTASQGIDDIINAQFLESSEREVYFNIGGKQDAICSIEEFDVLPKDGEMVPVLIIEKSGSKPIVSKIAAQKLKSWLEIEEIFKDLKIIEVGIDKILKKGLLVNYNQIQLFLPYSHAMHETRNLFLEQSQRKTHSNANSNHAKENPGQDNASQDLKQRNQKLEKQKILIEVKLLELNPKHLSGIVSERLAYEQKYQEKWSKFIEKYESNQKATGKVVKWNAFGIFVDIDGVIGLLHKNNLSWKKSESVKNMFKINQEIEVIILDILPEEKKVSLGYKQLQENPWEWCKKELKEGSVVKATVRTIVPYGAFIEIVPGLEALLHLKDMTWSKSAKNPNNFVRKGEALYVKVLDLNYEKEILSVGLKQLEANPWDEEVKELSLSQVYTGSIINITHFGSFVSITPHLEGLIRTEDYSWIKPIPKNLLKVNQKVEFKILHIDYSGKKIRCGIKQISENPFSIFKSKEKKGKILEVQIAKIIEAGLLVSIEQDSKTLKGLIPLSHCNLNKDQSLNEVFKVGDRVMASIQEVNDKDNKIILSIKNYLYNEKKQVMQKYIVKDNTHSTFSPFLVLGEMNKKK